MPGRHTADDPSPAGACPVALRVDALLPGFSDVADRLADELGVPRSGDALTALQWSSDGLQLRDLTDPASGPVRVDFLSGAVAHRRQQGGGSGQMIAKAVGIQPGIRPTVLDATAGLGRDAFVLATLGCSVTLIERHPAIVALLEDGLRRAAVDEAVLPILQRMTLLPGNAIDLMQHWTQAPPQVIYLDPMFPHRDKQALVKKEMRVFRPVVGDDADADALLAAALQLASHRVVVKRPRKAPVLGNRPPGYALEGKSSRYDIYPLRSLKAT